MTTTRPFASIPVRNGLYRYSDYPLPRKPFGHYHLSRVHPEGRREHFDAGSFDLIEPFSAFGDIVAVRLDGTDAGIYLRSGASREVRESETGCAKLVSGEYELVIFAS